MSPRISVALCTCNGSRHLGELLDSLASQSRQPDEWVICDDASEDDSIDILARHFEPPTESVRISRNEARLGATGNFNQALRQCTGDLIALCDQDDIWLPDKLARLAAALDNHPPALAVFTDAQVVDDAARPLRYTMWQHVGFSAREQHLLAHDQAWKVLLKQPVVTGATMMFRRELLEFADPIPECWVHDAWIAHIAAALGPIIALDCPLTLYRQHGHNAIGGERLTLLRQARVASRLGRRAMVTRERRRCQALVDRLPALPASARRDAMLQLAREKLTHLEIRENLPDAIPGRFPQVISEWARGNYRRFTRDWKSLAVDLFMS